MFVRVLSLEHPVLDFSSSPSITRQEYLADSDINRIVDRFLHTGVLPQPNLGRPSVDGLDSPGDFSEACDMLFAQDSQSDSEFSVETEQKVSSGPKIGDTNSQENETNSQENETNSQVDKKE